MYGFSYTGEIMAIYVSYKNISILNHLLYCFTVTVIYQKIMAIYEELSAKPRYVMSTVDRQNPTCNIQMY